MTTDRTNHDKQKGILTREFETVLKDAIASPYSAREPISSEITQNICNVIEALFIHGLRDPFFLKGSRYAKYPEPNFWPFVSKYTHKSITSLVNKLSQIKTEIGKSRSWIRLILNESSLENYIKLLTVEQVALNQFYYDFAYLRDSDHVDRLKGLLKGLSGLHIKAATNSSFLNSWTPSPLILAGVVAGKAVKIVTLPTTQKKVYFGHDDAGLSAPETQAPINPLLLSPIKKQGKHHHSESDDDGSSVYSHPSMVDRGEIPSRLFMSSTPTDESPYISKAPRSMGPLLVSRRTKRPRSSKSSSGSERSETNSKGSRSETASTVEMLAQSVPNSEPVRLPQSETLDSGIHSINRDAPSTSALEESEDKESEASSALDTTDDAVDPQVTITVEQTESEITEETDILNDNVFDDEAPVLDESTQEPQQREISTEEVATCSETVDVTIEASTIVLPELDVTIEEKTAEIEEEVRIQSTPIMVTGAPHKDSGLEVSGTPRSLHDELSALSLSLDPSFPGNSLVGAGGWILPKGVTSRINDNVANSSSSDTDSSGVLVSFGEALRSAMERNTPSDDEMTESDDPNFDENEHLRKISQRKEDILEKLTVVAKETGLAKQELRCPMCRKSIGTSFGFAKYGTCGVDGLHYCNDCMKPGGHYSIPSRVIRSWDWKPREVSDRGRAFIDANLDEPVFDIEALNPALYSHVPALNVVKSLRDRLQIVSLYLFNCRESVAEDFKKRLHPRQYLYDDVHRYSFMDLQNVRSGRLEKQILTWLRQSIEHIYYCNLCKQKGFICEMCSKREVIYPFNTESTGRCPDCNALFHKECSESGNPCPRCERRAKYEPPQEASELPFYS